MSPMNDSCTLTLRLCGNSNFAASLGIGPEEYITRSKLPKRALEDF